MPFQISDRTAHPLANAGNKGLLCNSRCNYPGLPLICLYTRKELVDSHH
jgi:hypothetical protein